MKKLLGILVLGLLLSGSAFAKTIYCFKPDEVGVFDLESSKTMLFFEIDDRSKKVKWLKDYYLTEFEYHQGSNSTSKKIFKFNKKNDFRYVNEYLNCLPTDQIRFYHDYYLDAVRNERDFKNRKEPCALFTRRDDDNYKIRSIR